MTKIKNKTPGEYCKALGDRIRQLRTAKSYTNHEVFAHDHEFSRTQYARYERGEDLRFTSLVRLVTAFEVTLEEFFSEGFD